MNPRVQAMVARGALRTEAGASQGVAAMLSKARLFLETARTEIDRAPSVAYANAYTAARQAVTALMWSQGLRIAERVREHETVIEFGRAALPATRELDLAFLDQMRRQRHAIEYEPTRQGTEPQAREACAFVERLLGAVEIRVRSADS